MSQSKVYLTLRYGTVWISLSLRYTLPYLTVRYGTVWSVYYTVYLTLRYGTVWSSIQYTLPYGPIQYCT